MQLTSLLGREHEILTVRQLLHQRDLRPITITGSPSVGKTSLALAVAHTVQLAFLWLDGGLNAQELLPVIIFNALAVPYLLAVIQLLDSQALAALKAMRPILAMPEKALERAAYQMSTMPVSPRWLPA